jgi:hypothetical protein
MMASDLHVSMEYSVGAFLSSTAEAMKGCIFDLCLGCLSERLDWFAWFEVVFVEWKNGGNEAALYLFRWQLTSVVDRDNTFLGQVHCLSARDNVDGHMEAMTSIVVNSMCSGTFRLSVRWGAGRKIKLVENHPQTILVQIAVGRKN